MKRRAVRIAGAKRRTRAVSEASISRARGFLGLKPEGITVEDMAERMVCCTAHARECIHRAGGVVVRHLDKGKPGRRTNLYGLQQAVENAPVD